MAERRLRLRRRTKQNLNCAVNRGMPLPVQKFKPSALQAAIENLTVSALLAGACSAIGWWREAPPLVTFGIGATVSIGSFVFYQWRYFKTALRWVAVSAGEITLVYSGNRVTEIPWRTVGSASLAGDKGFVWRFDVGGEIELRDDGFSSGTWEKMSDAIEAHLQDLNIPCNRVDELDEAAKQLLE